MTCIFVNTSLKVYERKTKNIQIIRVNYVCGKECTAKYPYNKVCVYM